MPRPSGGVGRRDPCAKCGLPVFIAERLNVGKQLYHRTCFRCARCNSQLTLANYYETEHENQFCCETCPDEEQSAKNVLGSPQLSERVVSRSLSDEEKSAGLKTFDDLAEFSSTFSTALENPILDKPYSLSNDVNIKARTNFITSQFADENWSIDSDQPPELPKTEPPLALKSEPSDLESPQYTEDCENINPTKKDLDTSVTHNISSAQYESFDSGYPSNVQSLETVVNSRVKSNYDSDTNQPETATDQLDINKIVTKENKFQEVDGENTSLVKSRMLLFENKQQSEEDKENLSTNSVEKFIQKVPLKDEDIFTESPSKNFDVNVDCKDSLVVEVSDEIESHIENDSIPSSFPSEKEENSVITISSESSEFNTSKCIVISDTTPEVSLEVENPKDYPQDLNPFGEEDEEVVNKKDNPIIRKSLNPFDSDEEEEEMKTPEPAVRKKIKIKNQLKAADITLSELHGLRIERISSNLFEDDEDDNSEKKRVLPAPRISLNPFWSDGEDPDEDMDKEKAKPVPLPRCSRNVMDTPEPKPRKSGLAVMNKTIFGSNTSLSSTHSSTGTIGRKKKQAPRPPIINNQDSSMNSISSSPNASVQHSPKSSLRVKKTKRAPLPPLTSTPFNNQKEKPSITFDFSIVNDTETKKELENRSFGVASINEPEDWETEKNIKDEVNKNRQSQIIQSPNALLPNKSTFGKWKRRKGPAPSRPIPQRRIIKQLPIVEIRRELEFIEIQQQGLEKQGVRLEQIIRDKCEGPHVDMDTSLTPDVEDLILQLFELVNEKNELFRKQAELMYLRRQQRLEEEYADLEYQIRCLMVQPEAHKTDSDKAREEELITRLVEVVERRNEIVECLEMDRVREAEEDDSINNQLNLYAAKREEEPQNTFEQKQKKKNRKEKKFKLKISKKVDADKDIDECETSTTTSLPIKEKKKKKFSMF